MCSVSNSGVVKQLE